MDGDKARLHVEGGGDDLETHFDLSLFTPTQRKVCRYSV